MLGPSKPPSPTHRPRNRQSRLADTDQRSIRPRVTVANLSKSWTAVQLSGPHADPRHSVLHMRLGTDHDQLVGYRV